MVPLWGWCQYKAQKDIPIWHKVSVAVGTFETIEFTWHWTMLDVHVQIRYLFQFELSLDICYRRIRTGVAKDLVLRRMYGRVSVAQLPD